MLGFCRFEFDGDFFTGDDVCSFSVSKNGMKNTEVDIPETPTPDLTADTVLFG